MLNSDTILKKQNRKNGEFEIRFILWDQGRPHG